MNILDCNIGDKVHVVYDETAYNAIIFSVDKESELVRLAMPDGRHSPGHWPLDLRPGHATENVATEQHLKEAAERGKPYDEKYLASLSK